MDKELQKLIEGFKEAVTASVCDAVDQVTGRRGFMEYDMRPVYPTKLVGPAVTVLCGPSVKPSAGMGQVFELMETSAGAVMVFVMGDKNMTGLGGMMAAGCKVGGVAGVVVDGAVRDTGEIEEMQLPVFSRGVSPSTAVGRVAPIATNVTVNCAGVLVSPGDIIVADPDGVVVVPQDKAKEVLELAQQMDATEREMTEAIWELKSLAKAFEKFGRI